MFSLLIRNAAAQKPMLIAKTGSKYLLISHGWAMVRVVIGNQAALRSLHPPRVLFRDWVVFVDEIQVRWLWKLMGELWWKQCESGADLGFQITCDGTDSVVSTRRLHVHHASGSGSKCFDINVCFGYSSPIFNAITFGLMALLADRIDHPPRWPT